MSQHQLIETGLHEDIRQQQPKLLEQVEFILKKARQIGADSAEVSVSVRAGFDVTVRQGDIDKVQFDSNQDFTIVLYRGHHKGSASTCDSAAASIQEAVEAAWHIAQHTKEDPCAGLADKEQMADATPDLNLYHPWLISLDEAKATALEMEAKAKSVDDRITNSGGATVATAQSCTAYGNSHGFQAAVTRTRHSMDCAVIASDDNEMQQDYWYTVSRQPNALESAQVVGRQAGERAVARLGAGPVATGKMPLVLAPWIAVGLVGHLLGAISGGSLYRKSSFLLDSLGQQVLPERYSLYERPYLPAGLGSAAFDGDGLATRDQSFITAGILNQYVLSTYSARRLGLQSSANSGGVHNLKISDDGLSQQSLLAEMNNGLYITELFGQGVNLVTGDYSRGAGGFLVESGKIIRPVQGITIAGNLKDLLLNIRAVGSDLETRGNLQVGSILIDGFTIGGS